MNNVTSIAFAVTIGAAVGSVVTWKLLKTKYEQIANEEIASVKEVYSKKAYNEIKEDAEKCEGIISKNEYVSNEKEGKSTMDKTKPCIISPEDLGESGYQTVSLTYYANGVLCDEEDNVVDIEGTIGKESLNHFGEYEDDSVCVRNDELGIDYEVLADISEHPNAR